MSDLSDWAAAAYATIRAIHARTVDMRNENEVNTHHGQDRIQVNEIYNMARAVTEPPAEGP